MKTILNDIIEKPHEGEIKYTPKDFKPDVDVRWCAGCGAYAVLSPVQRIMPELGIPKEKIVSVSGIGCSGRSVSYTHLRAHETKTRISCCLLCV